jgi:hypothetical protein
MIIIPLAKTDAAQQIMWRLYESQSNEMPSSSHKTEDKS